MADLATQRAGAAERLTTARRQRGQAVLDGGKVDHQAVVEARETLDAFDEAEGAAVARDRAAEQEHVAAVRQRLAGELVELEEKRLALVGEAEAATGKLVGALSGIVGAVEDERRLLRRMAMDDEDGVHSLGTRATMRRLGASIAASLSQMKLPGFARGVCREFGALRWFHAGMTPKPDWAKTERLVVTKELMKIIKKEI